MGAVASDAAVVLLPRKGSNLVWGLSLFEMHGETIGHVLIKTKGRVSCAFRYGHVGGCVGRGAYRGSYEG